MPEVADDAIRRRHGWRLDALETPGILLAPDYRILAANDAYAAHYGAAIQVGRDHCYAVSHGYASPCDDNGEQCPLRTSRASGSTERVFHVHRGPDGPEHVDVSMTPLFGEDGDLEAFVEEIRPIPEASAHAGGTFVGRSPAFVRLVEMMRRVAGSDTPVLLLGESGTGKELAASAIHDASPRARAPFVPVECSGLAETLFESELFGHAKGAFTGATVDKPGLVEVAAGGTLFLDEIGDISIGLQVKLLRLLESGLYRRVGDPTPRHAEFRLICATHRNLDSLRATGAFRDDLYYRISAFPIRLPPLRERREDVPLLAEAMLATARSPKRLGPEALRMLEHYHFPGNVRELRNLLERAALLADGETLGLEHFPTEVREQAGPDEEGSASWPWGETVIPLAEVERRYLTWALEAFHGDRRALAARLGLSERTLYRRLRGATREDG
ncbi:MAG: sigma 54-interacting transcriptional regulator [Myxococcales bacterium]|nr:sigma 54-interacting transcriptional regulator [Myxococcales bacterium]